MLRAEVENGREPLQSLWSVTDQDDAAALVGRQYVVEDRSRGGVVEVCGGFVQEHDGAVGEDGAGDPEAGPLPSGESAPAGPEPGVQPLGEAREPGPQAGPISASPTASSSASGRAGEHPRRSSRTRGARRRRRPRRDVGDRSSRTSTSSRLYRPRLGSRWRASTASSVLFPEPFGPTTAVRSPGASRARGCRLLAVTRPRRRDTSSSTIGPSPTGIAGSGDAGSATACSWSRRVSRRAPLPCARASAHGVDEARAASPAATGTTTSRAATGHRRGRVHEERRGDGGHCGRQEQQRRHEGPAPALSTHGPAQRLVGVAQPAERRRLGADGLELAGLRARGR